MRTIWFGIGYVFSDTFYFLSFAHFDGNASTDDLKEELSTTTSIQERLCDGTEKTLRSTDERTAVASETADLFEAENGTINR